MHHLPLINKVFSLLIQQELQQHLNNKDTKLVANFHKQPFYDNFSNQTPKSISTGCSRGHKFFSHCNKIGHTIEVCFKKQELPLYLKKPVVAHVSNTYNDQTNTHRSNIKDNISSKENIGLTPGQQKAFLNLLQQTQQAFPSTIHRLHYACDNILGTSVSIN